MAVEEQVVELLRSDPAVTALVDSRIYAMPAPQGVQSPFVTYQIIAARRIGRDYRGNGTHDLMMLQVDCWAEETMSTSTNTRYERVLALARAVRAALDRKWTAGEDIIDLILWTNWTDQNTPTATRRTLDFDLYVKDP